MVTACFKMCLEQLGKLLSTACCNYSVFSASLSLTEGRLQQNKHSMLMFRTDVNSHTHILYFFVCDLCETSLCVSAVVSLVLHVVKLCCFCFMLVSCPLLHPHVISCKHKTSLPAAFFSFVCFLVCNRFRC